MAGFGEEMGSEVLRTAFGQDGVDRLLRVGIGGAAQGQRDGTKPQLEQPVAAGGLQVILPLWDRPADQLDLAGIEAEPGIGGLRLWLDGTIIGQQDPLRKGLDDRGRDRTVGDVRQ